MINAKKKVSLNTWREEIIIRPRRRWEDNIRMSPTKIRREVLDWNHLTQNRDQWRAFMKTIMNLWAP
jgi:hypothetical protein